MSNELSLARKYQRNKDWEKAIEFFESYMDTVENIDDQTYVDYAKCLKAAGDIKGAEEAIQKGIVHHPKSESILKELHSLYDFKGDWKGAENVAEQLVSLHPEKANYHFRLGRTYAFRNKYEQAETFYKTGLKQKHGMSFDYLIEKIQRGFSDNPSEVSSKYTFTNGKNNFGAIIHTYGEKEYFTKISNYTIGAYHEEAFYRDLCAQFPVLKDIAPGFIDAQVIDKMLYLTIEMIDDDRFAAEQLEDVIKASSTITSILYKDIIDDYSNRKYAYQLKNRSISAVQFFTQIHQKEYNEKLMSALATIMKQQQQPKSVYQVIERLESIIIDNKLYTFIQPERHYTLQHGDLTHYNIKIEKHTGNLRLFDWATFHIGPRFMDMIRYFTKRFTPYSVIKDKYLFNEEANGEMQLIEQIFFLYALIVLYLLVPNAEGKSMNTRMDEFILPALHDMDELTESFKKDAFEHVVQWSTEERVAKQEQAYQVTKLKKKVQKLKKENKGLQRKLKNMESSKSWKITAPLRKIVQRKNK